MSLKKVDQAIGVIKYLLKKKRRRVDEIGQKVAPSEQEKIFIGQELELIQNVEVLMDSIKNEVNRNFGRIPPSSSELEEAVLGAAILESQSLPRIRDFLTVDHFYLQANKSIYGAVMQLNRVGQPIDMMTVIHKLRKDGLLEAVGGATYIATLTARVSSSANIAYHARIMVELAIKRRLIELGSNLINLGYDDATDALKLYEQATEELRGISEWIK